MGGVETEGVPQRTSYEVWRLGFGVTETLLVPPDLQTLCPAPFSLSCAPWATLGAGAAGVSTTDFPAGDNVMTLASAPFPLLSCFLGQVAE